MTSQAKITVQQVDGPLGAVTIASSIGWTVTASRSSSWPSRTEATSTDLADP
jgi:hypothetical protein